MAEVKLMVDDLDQITIIEDCLNSADIPYVKEVGIDNSYGMSCPFAIVDGVPLDLLATVTWIGERNDD